MPFDQLNRLLGDATEIPYLRRAIADLILDQLRELQKFPMHWDKSHFANAVAALGMNIHSLQQPTEAWLRLSLVDLQKAIRAIQPHAPYPDKNRHLNTVTLEELITIVESLRGELPLTN